MKCGVGDTRKGLLGFLVGAALLLAGSGEAFAVNRTWLGTTATWSTTSNWSGSALPGPSDNVYLVSTSNNPMTIDNNVVVTSFNIQSGYTNTISHTTPATGHGSYMLISGDFTMAGAATFNMPVDRLTIGGAFVQTAGTVVANGTSTLILTSTANRAHTFGTATFDDVFIGDALPITSNLIGRWTMNESSGNAADSSGNGNTLTAVGASHTGSPIVAPTLYGTYSSDYSSNYTAADYFEKTSTPAVFDTQTWSLSAWIRIDQTDTDTYCADIVTIGGDYLLRVCQSGSGQPATVSVLMRKNSDNTTYVTCSASNTMSVQNDDTWAHIVATNDDTKMIIWVDGVKTQCASHNAHQSYAGNVIRVGASATDGTRDFDGRIDDVRVWSRALTDAECVSLAMGTDETAGTVVHTASGTLTINGNLTLGSGTFSPSGNISLKGSWRNYGGYYNGSGTVTLTGTSATSEILTNEQAFAALTVASTGSGTWTQLDRMVVDGALTLTTGTLAASSYNTIVGSVSKTSGAYTKGTGTMHLRGGSPSTIGPTDFYVLRTEDPNETNLVGYWKFDERDNTKTRSSLSTANDATFYGNAALSSTKPGLALPNNKSLSLDGTGDYVQMANVTNMPAANAAQTISLWFLHNAVTGIQNFVALKNTASSSAMQLGMRLNGGTYEVQAWKHGGTRLIGLAAPAVDGSTWHHVVLVSNGSAAVLYLDGASIVTAITPNSATPTTLHLGTDGSGEYFNGLIDDVRIYNVALTSAQVANLYGASGAGNYAGTGGGTTYTLGSGTTTVSNRVTVHGGTLAVGGNTLNSTNTGVAVNVKPGASMTLAAGTITCDGGLTMEGSLSLTSSSGNVYLASGKTLSLDGTLTTNSGTTAGPTIRASTGTYTFQVGSTSSKTPTLNIDGLALRDMTAYGLQINTASGSATSSVTTFTKFDNIAFSNGPASSSYLLQIAAASLSLFGNGLTFDNSTTKTVKLTDTNAGSDTTAFFGATCNGSEVSCESTDEDSDTEDDGIANSGGAVLQWGHRGWTDTPGAVEGFSTTAFDWNTFSYYATYVAFNNGSSDALYMRDSDGKAVASWTLPNASTETFKGTPRWVKSSGIYYVFVVSDKGNVYKVQHVEGGAGGLAGDSFNQVATYRDGSNATATSGLMLDGSNVYWVGNSGSTADTPMLFAVTQSALGLVGSRSTTVAVAALPSIGTVGASNFVFAAAAGKFLKTPVAMTAPAASTTVLPAYAVYGRVSAFSHISNRAFFVDYGGKVWGVDTTSATDPSMAWYYQDGDTGRHAGGCPSHANCAARNIFVGAGDYRVYFGDKDGHVYAVYNSTGSTGAVIYNNYPVKPSTFTGEFQSAPLYRDGVIVIGTTTGLVYFIDQYNGTNSGGVYRTFNFKAGVSTISYDQNTSTTGEYVITTDDGKIYYISAATVPDPTNTYK